ncbi:hypothetical protein ACHAXR_012598 [Thalassiosira sp. AJA248-18]
MQEELDVNPEEVVNGSVGGRISLLDDRKPSSRGNNNSSPARATPEKGGNRVSSNTTQQGGGDENMRSNNPGNASSPARASSAPTNTTHERGGNASPARSAAAASATVARGEMEQEEVTSQIESDELIAKMMQEELDVNPEEVVNGSVGGRISLLDDRKPSSRGNNNSSPARATPEKGGNRVSSNTTQQGGGDENMRSNNPGNASSPARASSAPTNTTHERGGNASPARSTPKKDGSSASTGGNNSGNTKSGEDCRHDMDSDDESRFSEVEDGEPEEGEPSNTDIDRAVQRMEQGRSIIDEGTLITYDKSFELCCFMCRCGNEDHDKCQIKEILPSLSRSGGSSSPYYVRVHRACCTTLRKFVGEERAVTDYGIAVSTPPTNKKRRRFKAPEGFLAKSKEKADNLRTTVLNDLTYNDPVSFRESDERYIKNRLDFRTLKQRAKTTELKAANVLSLFSGIGAGILVLKRLGVAINNCVVVEHDPIAEAVCSKNHKADVDNYHWIETFEEFEQNFDQVMEKCAPINIVEGGPPCVEFSAINANREGIASVKGRYMIKFADLILRIKNHRLQKNENVFFLCENVQMKEEDLKHFEPKFGISPIIIDAQNVSPSKRKRSYSTNLPVNDLPEPDSALALSTVKLADGWMHPAQLYCLIHNEPEPYTKANTFMASEGRIDDERMIKVRLVDSANTNLFETSCYTVGDREALLGFPKGYVKEKGELLLPFPHLRHTISCETANSHPCFKVTMIFEKLSDSFHSENWLEQSIDNGSFEELSAFSGRQYKFVCGDKDDPMVRVKFGTVEKNSNGKTLYYYDCEGYCKRLLGNSYSIPVVEHLLHPIKDLFLQREYSDAEYSFVWEPRSNE